MSGGKKPHFNTPCRLQDSLFCYVVVTFLICHSMTLHEIFCLSSLWQKVTIYQSSDKCHIIDQKRYDIQLLVVAVFSWMVALTFLRMLPETSGL